MNFIGILALFFDTLYSVQTSKSNLIDTWYVTNGTFLKNNTEFENKFEKLTNLD